MCNLIMKYTIYILKGKTNRFFENVFDNEEFILPSSQCKEHEKPIELMTCNAQHCPAEWFARPFGQVPVF